MPITINGSGTVTGISVGGLPDGIVDADTLAAGAAPTQISESSWTAFGTGTTTEITGISANAREITVVGVDISAVDNSQLLKRIHKPKL